MVGVGGMTPQAGVAHVVNEEIKTEVHHHEERMRLQ